MGKITDALKKVELEREMRKQNEPKDDKPKDALSSEGQEAKTTEKQKRSHQLTLEERLKERAYVAKTTDDSGIASCIITYFDPTSPVSEQYRILRTNIQSKSLNKSAKVFLISSTSHSEGKTVTAINLAVALAQDLDKRVFLGDCDLRGGNIHQLLNLKASPGLSDIMVNGTASELAFHNSKIQNLTVLPRGQFPSNPSELLGSKRMKRLLEELKSRFDYIILDSPPTMPFTDAGILGAQTDGVMFVVQAQKTQEQTIRQARETLEQARAKIIGFVFTQTEYHAPGYYSYYYRNTLTRQPANPLTQL